MRLIAQLDSRDTASTLADVLYLRGIETELADAPPHRAPAGAIEIWVLDEDRVAEARALYSRYIALPSSPEFRTAPAEAATKRSADASQAASATRDLARRAAPALSAFTPSPPRVTIAFLALAALAALLLHLFPIYAAYLLPSPPAILRGEIWRLLTPLLLHRDFWHLLLMMFWTWDLGAPLERHMGPRAFAALALSVSVVGILVQTWLLPAPVGLGTLVYGLLAYAWLRSRRSPSFRLPINPYTPLLLLVYLALAFLGVLGPLPLPAYLASLLSGLLLALFPRR